MRHDGGVRGIILAAGKGSRMKSDLPKVLHEIHHKPMIQYGVETLESVGVEEIVVVVGYRHELIEDRFREQVGHVRFAVQKELLGTGHAVMQAAPFFEGYDGHVFVTYGDMPMLDRSLLQNLRTATLEAGATGAILTLTMEQPPEWGRIVRDGKRVTRIVEVRDASPDVLAISEVNVGAYFLHAPSLFQALSRISNDNAQGEYYLTDVVGVLAADGHDIVTVPAPALDDVMGINAPYQLEYAEKLAHIEYAEGLYELIDAVVAMQKDRSGS